MARPLKENLDYFQHDCKASSDERLEIFETKYPNGLGYAWFFKTLERIYFHCGKLDVSDAETRKLLCKNLNVDPDEIIEYSISNGLFDKKEYENNHILTSNRIKKAINPILFKREKMAKEYQKRISGAETPEKPIVPEAEIDSRVEIEYIKDIIDFLNLKTGSTFKKNSKSTNKHISARIREGYSLDDFKMVIDFKNLEWGENPEMKEYLRPITLFGTKFESYLMAAKSKLKKLDKPIRIIQ
ncbi:MAG: conserved phage C-terminal domain-containing protein [Candidatus Omnitrophica bacterium]|nr:conserved phage C-terminal domain-containing protein [Candidatus Omnitrophota bacterium]